MPSGEVMFFAAISWVKGGELRGKKPLFTEKKSIFRFFFEFF